MQAPALLHIANLPVNAGEDFLKEFLADYGPILNVVIKPNNDTNIAFVQFKSLNGVFQAVYDLNYTMLNDNQLILTPAIPEYMNSIKEGGNMLFVQGVADGIQADQLSEVFSDYGEVLTVKIPQEEEVKGIAYVQFKDPESAAQAAEELNGAEIAGSVINILNYRSVQKHQKFKNPHSDTFTTVILQNISKDITQPAELGAFLLEYGTVVKAMIVNNGAFAVMSSHDEAVKVINALNGKEIDGQKIIACKALSTQEKAALYALASRK